MFVSYATSDIWIVFVPRNPRSLIVVLVNVAVSGSVVVCSDGSTITSAVGVAGSAVASIVAVASSVALLGGCVVASVVGVDGSMVGSAVASSAVAATVGDADIAAAVGTAVFVALLPTCGATSVDAMPHEIKSELNRETRAIGLSRI